MRIKLEFPTNHRSPNFAGILARMKKLPTYRIWVEKGTSWHSVDLGPEDILEHLEDIRYIENWRHTRVWFRNKPYLLLKGDDSTEWFYDLYNFILAGQGRANPHQGICLRITMKDILGWANKRTKDKIAKAKTPRELLEGD